MAQGFARKKLFDGGVFIEDTANLDAFSRLRISSPQTSFNSQFTYNLLQLLFEQITSGGGSISHNTTDRCANITLTAAVATDKAYMQTFEYFSYQPGKSQLIFITFNMEGQATGAVKFAGYSDGDNGVEFQVTGTDVQFVIYSDTTAGDETVLQANWNLDPLNGSGPSGINLDTSATQILVIDLQALYVGRVRVGFDIGGSIIYAHEFLHANTFTVPYVQYASLPVRCGMTATGAVTATMKFICSAVISEGGSDDDSRFAFNFAVNSGLVSVAALPGFTHMMSIRPKTTFNGITNRVKTSVIDLEVYNSGNQPIYWELVLGQALAAPAPTYNDVNATYSSTQYVLGGALSGSPALTIDAGYVGSSGASRVQTTTTVTSRYPMTLTAAGATRSLGTYSLIAYSLSGTQDCYAIIKLKEIR